MSKISRGNSLPYELTKVDLSPTLIAVVGYAKGEILPPYDSERHRKRAKNILSYIKGKRCAKMELMFEYESLEDICWQNGRMEVPKVVEVVGGLLGHCVLSAVVELLEKNHYVRVSPDRIITWRPSALPPFFIGKILLQEVLGGDSGWYITPNARCHIYNKEFIFYMNGR